VYKLSVVGIDTLRVLGTDEVVLGPTESRAVPVSVRVDEGKGEKGSNKIYFTLTTIDNPDVMVKEKAVFFVPR
jgi:hypothetical protein